MKLKEDNIRILSPGSLRDLLSLLKEYPNAMMFAGGTHIMQQLHTNEPESIPDTVFSLTQIDELTRIRRKEHTIEIGACVPISRILSLGPNIVPRILIDAMKQISSPSIRNSATIGGNLCLGSPFSDLIVPLTILDARIEVRSPLIHTWMPIARFIRTPWKNNLLSGEVCTAVSIPITPAQIQTYRSLEVITAPTLSVAKFAGLAHIYRGTVTDFRMIIGGLDPLFHRNREIESTGVGRKVPFSPKFIQQFCDSVKTFVDACDPGFLPDKYHRKTSIRLCRQFIERVSSHRGV
ncbi:MAG: FAD binding domain-containing protein [Spirochaetales bacterium]|nr:FAD binding domain-containing protein [Spirochaetales bacterium]